MTDSLETNWISHAAAFNVTLSAVQQNQFERYAELLAAGNTRTNLTRIVEPQAIRIRHFLDSLTVAILPIWNPTDRSLVDVGTGAGFPGLALAIAYPALQVTLIDSVRRKADFLQRVVEELSLENVRVLAMRAEDAGRAEELRERFDFAVARSVARLPTLLEYLLPLVRIDGAAIVWKGATAARECADSEFALRELGVDADPVADGASETNNVHDPVSVQLPGVDSEHFLVTFSKVRSTPQKYPRRAGQPSKRPLLRPRVR